MAKRQSGRFLNFIAWLTGVLVSLAVGFGMVGTNPTLVIPWIPMVITQIAGWVVIVTTIVSVVMAILTQ